MYQYVGLVKPICERGVHPHLHQVQVKKQLHLTVGNTTLHIYANVSEEGKSNAAVDISAENHANESPGYDGISLKSSNQEIDEPVSGPIL